MARIKINDLPKDVTISKEGMKSVLGGGSTLPLPDRPPWDDPEGGGGQLFLFNPFTLQSEEDLDQLFAGDPRPTISLRGQEIRIP